MAGVKKKLSSYWWFDRESNITRKSSWLRATLAELDEKTETMLKLIEDDADSFAERAEMYYKKRPELINIIEDFYQAHRSLALRHDQHRTSHVDDSYDSSYESIDSNHDQDSGAPEIIDPHFREEESSCASNNEEVINLREEIASLHDENKFQKEFFQMELLAP
ncbi:NETWORKED 3A-like protein [Tanacetum coccineum]